MSIVLVGLNHKTAPVEIREKIHFAEENLSYHQDLIKQEAVDEGFILSTCNRVELCVATDSPSKAIRSLLQFISNKHDGDIQKTKDYFYAYEEMDAVQHTFRVTSSLDSMVVGESQILGQVKDAYRRSKEAGTLGPRLHRFYDKAFSVAKRVRSETSLGQKPVSIASVAVDLSQKIFNHLNDKVILLIGAGEMTQTLISHLKQKGTSQFYLTNRTQKTGADFKFVPLEDFTSYLDKVDMIFTSTASPDYLLTQKIVQEAMVKRKNKPLFCIDISVPRNIDPAIHQIDNVYLYDVDDLEIIVKENFKQREHAAQIAEKIVSDEATQYYQSMHQDIVAPTLKSIQEKIENIRSAEMTELKKYLSSSNTSDLNHIDKFTQRFASKLLHEPLQIIKEEASHDNYRFLKTLRQLFRL